MLNIFCGEVDCNERRRKWRSGNQDESPKRFTVVGDKRPWRIRIGKVSLMQGMVGGCSTLLLLQGMLPVTEDMASEPVRISFATPKSATQGRKRSRASKPSWETNGHGEFALERSHDLKFTALEDGGDLKKHAILGKKSAEKGITRVISFNSREFNERRRKISHDGNAESDLEFAAVEDCRERKRYEISGTRFMEDEKARVSSLTLCEFDERGAHRRKKRKKKVEEENGMVSDPLVVFGSDLMLTILYRLDARSLAQSILVSRGWQALAASDCLWSKKCEELWIGKAHLPRAALQRGISKLAAYSISVRDAKRTRIMREDLCSHAWEFRFKTPAPMYWLNLDPSWRGTGPPMRRYFHPDGSQTADPTDKVWGGHECTYSIVTSCTDNGKIREHYVRIQRWPRMSVSRKQDWGWELDNHVYCYSSIPDADKEGGTGPLSYLEDIER